MNRYEALKHAVKAHAGAVDKCGRPYVLHPIAVAEAIDNGPNAHERGERAMLQWIYGGDKEDAVVVALLHDVLEDTDYPLSLSNEEQWLALEIVTKLPGESYADYIEGICNDLVASIVKLADLWHNLQPERQSCLPSKEAASLEKRYLKARDRIWEALGYEWWLSEAGGE